MHGLKPLIALPLLFALLIPANAQDESLEDKLREMVSDNAKGYLAPVATAFGTSMNSGTFRKARPHKLFGFDATVNFSFTAIPQTALTYDFIVIKDLTLPIPLGTTTYQVPLDGDQLYPVDNRATPTFFGSDAGVTLAPDADYAFNATKTYLVGQGVPGASVDAIETDIRNLITSELTFNTIGGINLEFLPMVMPQIALGLPFGLEFMLRGFTVPLGDGGDELKFSGYGVKFYLNKVLPTIPLVFPAMSVGYYRTNMDLAGVITASNNIINFQASKSIPFITVYGGIGLENSSISIMVDDAQGNNLLDFKLDGENRFRTTVGVRLKLLLLSINYDYNAGEYVAHNIGLGLTFR
ncbi:MAG: hypothetical protein IIA59_04030 [Candidatus Marinimicrobia bacterium]|nr:hypothetical protein [Candidatus Neomarinimicrobiota bacterium]